MKNCESFDKVVNCLEDYPEIERDTAKIEAVGNDILSILNEYGVKVEYAGCNIEENFAQYWFKSEQEKIRKCALNLANDVRMRLCDIKIRVFECKDKEMVCFECPILPRKAIG